MKSEAFEMQAGSTYSGPIAIIAVEEKNPKVKLVAAKVGEQTVRLVLWAAAKHAADVAPGVLGQAEIAVEQKGEYIDAVLKAFKPEAGSPQPQPQPARPAFQPKSDNSIACQVCIKAAAETSIHNAMVENRAVDPGEIYLWAKTYIDAYKNGIKVLEG